MKALLRYIAVLALIFGALSRPGLSFAADVREALAAGKEKVQIIDQWDFYWNKLLEPSSALPEQSTRISVASVWNAIKLPDGTSPTTFGYGSYRREIEGLPPGSYEIGLRGTGDAFRMFVFPKDDPSRWQEVRAGVVGERSGKPSRHYRVLPIVLHKTTDLVIIIQVSNHNYSYGGAYYPPEISKAHAISQTYQDEGVISLVGMGIMIAVGIYSGMMWVRRRSDLPAAFLAITSFAAAVRVICTSPFCINLIDDRWYGLVLRLEYVSMPMGVASYLLFLRASFQPDKPSRATQVVVGLDIFLIVATFFVSTKVFPGFLPVYQVAIFLNAVLFPYFVGIAIKQRITGYRYVFLGCTLIVVAIASDIILAIYSNNAFYATPLAVMIFLILQSQMVALRAAESYTKAEKLSKELTIKNEEITFFNKNLEKLVEQKTQEIRSLLDNIPQGVFSIDYDGRISKEYSAHLTDILEHDRIASTPFHEVLLSSSTLSSDTKDQITQSVQFMLNESLLNFEVNADKLPYELDFITPRQEIKSLESTWSPLLDPDGNVRKILVTLHDVSEQKLLKRQAQEQMDQLLMIQELLRVTPEKTRQFFATASTLLEENQQILTAPNLDKETFRILFVNAHTVKGAARSLQFKRLANDIHEAEHSYSLNIKGESVDVEQMKAEIAKALSTLQSYMSINRDVLHREAADTKVTIDRDFLISHDRILRAFVDSPQLTLDDVRKTLRDQSALLTKLIFESLDSILDEYREMTAKIAKDIGKPTPRLIVQVPDIPVAASLRTALDNCMIHALRNALDHGLEFPEERLRKNKPAEGKIEIEGQVLHETLQLTLRDDGRGLALEKLRQKGLKSGQLTPNSSRQDVANMVFEQGVSTAQTVSQISGRGVGMDAIQKFLRDLGGDVEILLGPALDARDEYASFALVLRFPLAAQNQEAA